MVLTYFLPNFQFLYLTTMIFLKIMFIIIFTLINITFNTFNYINTTFHYWTLPILFSRAPWTLSIYVSTTSWTSYSNKSPLMVFKFNWQVTTESEFGEMFERAATPRQCAWKRIPLYLFYFSFLFPIASTLYFFTAW